MRVLWDLFMVGALIAALSTSAGCTKKTETGTASINGGTAGTGTAASPSSSQADPARTGNVASDPLHPVVKIQTSEGSITLELDKSQARMTVDNFLDYVKRGHYDQTIFHQVLKDYAIMGGAYTSDGSVIREKKPRPPIYNEAQKCGLKNKRGTIAMVRKPDVQDSATCQFFINVTDNSNLDYRGQSAEEYGYCPFGKVTSGMEVVKKIAEMEVTDTDKEVEHINKDGKAEKTKNLFERIPKQAVLIESIRWLR